MSTGNGEKKTVNKVHGSIICEVIKLEREKVLF